jgi:pimeloyl-ACP methyl ester carboxylesterase
MLAHKIYGHGPRKVIALHGWLGDGSSFEPMLTAVQPEEFAVALPDYRGYGRSRDDAGPYDLATIARDVLELADGLGWSRVSLLGHSMGGKAALKVAALSPERVEKILGVTPVWAGPAPFDSATTEFFRSAASDVSVRAAILSATTGERLPPYWSSKLARESADGSTREAFAGYCESWAFDDFAAEVAGLDKDVLVVVGAHDSGVPMEVVSATWLAHLPKAQLEVYGDAGHYPMLETPLQLAATFERFFRG